jgi:hypothetical protein
MPANLGTRYPRVAERSGVPQRGKFGSGESSLPRSLNLATVMNLRAVNPSNVPARAVMTPLATS